MAAPQQLTTPKSERGSFSMMVAVLFLAALAMMGMLVDGGRKIVTVNKAQDLASETARHVASRLDPLSLQEGEPVARNDFQSAASAYVSAHSGGEGTLVSVSAFPSSAAATQITVTVTINGPTPVFLLGLDLSATATHTAQVVSFEGA